VRAQIKEKNVAQQKNGKRSSKVTETKPRQTVRIPADQRALGRWGRKCIWTGSDYVVAPLGSAK
jgi:hypothetical protein